MPKAKTHSSLKKRVKVTGTGKIKTMKIGRRHLLQNKTSKAKGRDNYGTMMPDCDAKKVQKALNI